MFWLHNLPTTKLLETELCKGGLRAGIGEFQVPLETCRGSFWFRRRILGRISLPFILPLFAVFPESLSDSFFLAEKGSEKIE